MGKKDSPKKLKQFKLPKKNEGSSLEQFSPDATEVASTLASSLGVPAGLLEAQEVAEKELGIGEVLTNVEAFATRDGRVDRTNILGTSIGMKESGGTLTGEWAVRVYVKEKVSASGIGDGLIPQVYGAYATDVVEIGEVYPESGFRNFERPARCGSSCGHLAITAGTIGCLCTKNNRLMMLSNNHVLANSNNASSGDFIVHPGPADGGVSNTNVIGALEDFVPIDFAGTNSVDAALAFTSFSLVSPEHRTYTMNPNPIMATHGMPVMKNGRTTGLTFGRIAGINASLPINFGTRFNPIIARFSGQMEIHGVSGRFSDGGDSGSLIVEETTNRPTGLLFAGNGVSTWANPIQRVMSELGIDELVDRVF